MIGTWDCMRRRSTIGRLRVPPDDVGPMIGPDAMRAYHRECYEMFSDFTVATVEVHDAGPGRVIAVLRIGGTARESGVPVEMQFSVL